MTVKIKLKTGEIIRMSGIWDIVKKDSDKAIILYDNTGGKSFVYLDVLKKIVVKTEESEVIQ